MRRGPDRALKRAAADLARLHPDDVEAILGALDREERNRLDRAIAGGSEIVGPESGEPDTAPPQEPIWAYKGVSPWLVDRIDPDARSGGRPARDFVLMTEASREALRSASAPLRIQLEGKARPGPALLARAIQFLAGPRT